MYLGQLRGNEAELMVTEKLPEGQCLTGAMNKLLDALQGHLLIGLGLGWTHRVGRNQRRIEEGHREKGVGMGGLRSMIKKTNKKNIKNKK